MIEITWVIPSQVKLQKSFDKLEKSAASYLRRQVSPKSLASQINFKRCISAEVDISDQTNKLL